MFQFTTTTVINSNQLPDGKAVWSAQEATDDYSANLVVKKVNKFVKDNVKAIYKAEAYDGELAKITLDLSQIDGTDGDQYRLYIYIGLTQGSQESIYSNDLEVKGKPLSVDFVWDSDAATTVERLVKTINKYELLVYGHKILTVSYSGTYLTIEATNEYQKLVAVNIDKFDAGKYAGMGEYTTVRSIKDVVESAGGVAESNENVTSAAEAFFPGKEGFGTYSYILHNLRIPTYENYRPFGTFVDERPILGAKYNQYTIHYLVDRGTLGMNAVGQQVTSLTTHVFYVNQDIADDFESALGYIGDIEEV